MKKAKKVEKKYLKSFDKTQNDDKLSFCCPLHDEQTE